MNGKDDEKLLESSPEDFARRMAEGEGDYDWDTAPEGQNQLSFVESLDVAFPQWDPAFLVKVQKTLTDHWEEIADWAELEVEPETPTDIGDTETVRTPLVRLGSVAVSTFTKSRTVGHRRGRAR